MLHIDIYAYLCRRNLKQKQNENRKTIDQKLLQVNKAGGKKRK